MVPAVNDVSVWGLKRLGDFTKSLLLILALPSAVALSQSTFPFSGYVNSWDFDGQRMAATTGNDIYVWDVASGTVLMKARGYGSNARSVQFIPGSEYLLSSSGTQDDTGCMKPEQMSIQLFNIRTGSAVWTLKGRAIASLSSDGEELITFGPTEVSPCLDGGIDVWKAATGKKLYSIPPGEPSRSAEASISDDGRLILNYSSNQGTGTILEADSGHTLYAVRSAERPVFTDPQGDVVVTTSDGFLAWSASTHKTHLTSFTGQAIDLTYKHAWTSNGSQIAGQIRRLNPEENTPAGCNVAVWDVRLGMSSQLEGCARGASVLRFAPRTNRLLLKSGGYRSSGRYVKAPTMISMWDITTGLMLWKMDGTDDPIHFAPDGKSFVLVHQDTKGFGADIPSSLTVFDTNTGAAIPSRELHNQDQ